MRKTHQMFNVKYLFLTLTIVFFIALLGSASPSTAATQPDLLPEEQPVATSVEYCEFSAFPLICRFRPNLQEFFCRKATATRICNRFPITIYPVPHPDPKEGVFVR